MTGRPTEGGQPRLFPAEAFGGFGPSLFRAAGEEVVARGVRGARAVRLHRGVRAHAPPRPGVYGMIDAKGRVVYVGKAKSLRCRLLSYFRENSRLPKAGKIIDHTRVLVWEQTADEFSALLRELELIQRLAPRFNVLGQIGHQRYHYLCVGKSPAPFVHVVKAPTGKDQACFGPLATRTKSEDAARRLNDWFKLRDCPQSVPMVFSDQTELFPHDRAPKCIRLEIATCAGPCAAACSRAEYADGVRAVKAFLDGRDRTVLRTVKELMAAAAANFEFEKATAMRDRLQSLEWLDDRLALLRRARHRNSFVYPLAVPGGPPRWYLIHRGQVRAALPAPETAEEKERAAVLIRTTFDRTPPPTILTGGAVDSVLLVAAWFRKYPTEKLTLMTKAAALAKCATEQPASSRVTLP